MKKTLFILSHFIISMACALNAQISCGNGKLTIGPAISNNTYDFTINGLNELYWVNNIGKENYNWMSILLLNDHRACISGRGYEVKLYNPITNNYNIVKCEWMYTNANPPQIDPDNLPSYDGYNMISSIKAFRSVNPKNESPYILDLSQFKTNNDNSMIDGPNNQLYSPTDLIPVTISAMHYLRETNNEISTKLIDVRNELERRGIIAKNESFSMQFDKVENKLILESNAPIIGNLIITDISGNIELSSICNDKNNVYSIDCSGLKSGIHIAVFDGKSINKSIQFIK